VTREKDGLAFDPPEVATSMHVTKRRFEEATTDDDVDQRKTKVRNRSILTSLLPGYQLSPLSEDWQFLIHLHGQWLVCWQFSRVV
jgi:hypothetical protein